MWTFSSFDIKRTGHRQTKSRIVTSFFLFKLFDKTSSEKASSFKAAIVGYLISPSVPTAVWICSLTVFLMYSDFPRETACLQPDLNWDSTKPFLIMWNLLLECFRLGMTLNRMERQLTETDVNKTERLKVTVTHTCFPSVWSCCILKLNRQQQQWRQRQSLPKNHFDGVGKKKKKKKKASDGK